MMIDKLVKPLPSGGCVMLVCIFMNWGYYLFTSLRLTACMMLISSARR